jgi:dTDP-4-amino-4,6-dideoxygalactose transaminase
VPKNFDGDAELAVKERLAAITQTQPTDWFLTYKARYALEVVFRTIPASLGNGAVLTQAFTCATAVNPIIAAGLSPRYGDINPDLVALDPDLLNLDSSTPDAGTLRGIVAQNTFGIIDSTNTRRLSDQAHAAGAILIEDSAHCVTRMARDASGQPIADVSVHSFGVEKMLPTSFGGAIWINPNLAEPLNSVLRSAFNTLTPIGKRQDFAAHNYRTQIRVLRRLPAVFATPLRNLLITSKLHDPAIARCETAGLMPGIPQKPSPWVAKKMLQALNNISEIENHRREIVKIYLSGLNNIVQIPAGIDDETPLVRFPFYAPKSNSTSTSTKLADRIISELNAEGIYAGKWYRPALFPGPVGSTKYNYATDDERLTNMQAAIHSIVNLPTFVSVTEAQRIVQETRKIIENL